MSTCVVIIIIVIIIINNNDNEQCQWEVALLTPNNLTNVSDVVTQQMFFK